MRTLYDTYRKNKVFELGGAVGSPDPYSMIIQTALAAGNGIVDATAKEDPITGRASVGTTIAKGYLSGNPFGPVMGLMKAIKDKQEATRLTSNMATNKVQEERNNSGSLSLHPELLEGFKNSGYYANGGEMTKFAKSGTDITAPLASMFMAGGKAKSLSSDNALMVGPSHAKGGIQIPGMNAEVEGGETTKGDYVFSKRLGFADLHKPLATTKGKIELKPLTQDRLNAIKLINKREMELQQAQEIVKSKMGVQ